MVLTPHKIVLQPPPKLFLGDSWFGSVQSAEALALKYDHAIFVVKTGFDRSPRKLLEEETKECPGGTLIVLEGTTSQGVTLLTVSYKYSQRKVITFVMTKGAGSTFAEESYRSRFPDAYGKEYVQNVPRPTI